MTIENWIKKLVTVLEGVTGIEQVHTYDDVPGTILAFPTAIVMPVRGTQSYSAAGPGLAIHRVTITMYFAGGVLPEAMGKAVPFIGTVRAAIAANVTLSGSVAYCLPPDDGPFYEGPGGLRYGDKEMTGLVFHLVVKEVETITVS